jgi:serine/threonine protein kinase
MSHEFQVDYDELLGEGAYAQVWSALRTCPKIHDSFEYVAKVTTFGDQGEWPKSVPPPVSFFSTYIEAYHDREFQVLLKLQDTGAVPLVFSEWKAGEDGFLILERLNPNPVGEFGESHARIARENLRMIHLRGFAHCDLHSDNIMFKPGTDELVFIDFQCSLRQGDDPGPLEFAQHQDIIDLEKILRDLLPTHKRLRTH